MGDRISGLSGHVTPLHRWWAMVGFHGWSYQCVVRPCNPLAHTMSTNQFLRESISWYYRTVSASERHPYHIFVVCWRSTARRAHTHTRAGRTVRQIYIWTWDKIAAHILIMDSEYRLWLFTGIYCIALCPKVIVTLLSSIIECIFFMSFSNRVSYFPTR
jgi:hypothetical protein